MEIKSEKRLFTAEDELRYKFIRQARLSPDGKKVVYALKESDLEKNEVFSSLYLVDLETDTYNARRLTWGNWQDTAPVWSPDGAQIAFTSNREGKTQIYRIAPDGGEARCLTDLKQGVGSGPAWSPDGEFIAFTAGRDQEPRDPSKPYRVTRTVYRFDGLGYVDDGVRNVFIIPAQGGEVRQLTDGETINRQLNWSPDSRSLLYLAGLHPDSNQLFDNSLNLVDLKGKVTERVSLDWGGVFEALWLPQGEQILFWGARNDIKMGANSDLWLVDPQQGGEPQNLTHSLDLSFLELPSGFSEAGYFTASLMVGGEGRICRFNLDGEMHSETLLSGPRTAEILDMGRNKLLYRISKAENPGELYVSDLQGGQEKQITFVNSDLLTEIKQPEIEHLCFDNGEGTQIEGWLLKPAEGKAPYPTVLYIHGGPHGGYGYQFRADFQMLAGAGYAVLFLNPRGSMGYGSEFGSALSGHWGVMDYVDQMAGVDHVIKKGLADPDRLGVCGLSYGGYMTCYIVGQTQRFKAAAAENPITDLVSRYGTADMGSWGSLGEIGGKPHEIPEVYYKSSPINYAHLCATPTLLVQGEKDYRCPAGQSEQFYTVLKASGCITEMLRLPDMPHVGSIEGPLDVRRAQNEALLDWMNRFILNITTPEEK